LIEPHIMEDPDLHIVAALARALGVTQCPSLHQSAWLAQRIDPVLTGTNNQTIAAALTLAAQVRPWDAISPVDLLCSAIDHKLWHAAERVTAACVDQAEWSARTAEALVDAAYDERTFRKADKYATRFMAAGAHSRLLDARFMHACDTIRKIAAKGGVRLIERQAEIMQRTVDELQEYYRTHQLVPPDETFHGAATLTDAVEQIRQVSFYYLELVEDSVGIAHLANVWGMDYKCDEATLQAAREQRRLTYYQWHELTDGPVPDLLATPEALQVAFAMLTNNNDDDNNSPNCCYGFDTEWGEEHEGVALLQLASFHRVILIDVPSLSKTEEGVKALADTVGQLFAEPTISLVGFACKGDVSKLRPSPCAREEHWLGDVSSLIDVQCLVGKSEGEHKQIGLSRCSEDFLGKPLDKLEQCSDWMKRPLSLSQRTYAALDALACVLLYQKVVPVLPGQDHAESTGTSPR
jgi:3'-5' exonuclease